MDGDDIACGTSVTGLPPVWTDLRSVLVDLRSGWVDLRSVLEPITAAGRRLERGFTTLFVRLAVESV
jgi:hypothetical protein